MILQQRGNELLLLDLPYDFTLPERFPVSWSPEHQSFSMPRRHRSVPSLLRLLRERGLLEDGPVARGA